MHVITSMYAINKISMTTLSILLTNAHMNSANARDEIISASGKGF